MNRPETPVTVIVCANFAVMFAMAIAAFSGHTTAAIILAAIGVASNIVGFIQAASDFASKAISDALDDDRGAK